MKTGEIRKFTLADGLIVIAGIGAGLAACRGFVPGLTLQNILAAFAPPRDGWSLEQALLRSAHVGPMLGTPFLAAWTPVCLLLQLTKTRAGWHRLRRQPGFVACLIATTVVIVTAAFFPVALSLNVRSAPAELPMGLIKEVVMAGTVAGSGVLWGWFALKVSGVWRPVPAWNDRLARLTGAVWIAAGAMSAVYLAFVLP